MTHRSIYEVIRRRELKRARHCRSYKAKIKRGECGHCAQPLGPGSTSCCVFHESYFREKMREKRGRQQISQIHLVDSKMGKTQLLIIGKGLTPRSDFVTRPPLSLEYQLRSSARITLLPLEWILNPDKGKSFANRVLARLIQLEAHEPDVWLREDIRQSFITLSLALKGYSQPFVAASYRMYGLHPDKLYPAILARRKMLLGSESFPGSIKKPVQSVKPPAKKEDIA